MWLSRRVGSLWHFLHLCYSNTSFFFFFITEHHMGREFEEHIIGKTTWLSLCNLTFYELLNKELKANLIFSILEIKKKSKFSWLIKMERKGELLFQISKYLYLLHSILFQKNFRLSVIFCLFPALSSTTNYPTSLFSFVGHFLFWRDILSNPRKMGKRKVTPHITLMPI